MKRDLLDELLRRKLDGYQEVPPGDAWSRIEAGLSGIRPRPAIRWMRYAAAASILVAALAAGVYLGNRDETPIAVGRSTAEPVVFKKIAPEPIVFHPPGILLTEVSYPDFPTQMAEISIDSPSLRADPPAADEHAAPDRSSGEAGESAGQTEVRKTAQPEWYRTPERGQTKRKNRKSGRGISASLYAVNMSWGGSQSAAPGEKYYLMSSDMSSSPRARASASVFSARGMQKDLIWEHRTPITLGAAVSFRIVPNISLETGLTFTRLRSTTEMQALTAYEIEQKLDYVGVPISATYTFLDSRYVTLYGRAGGTLEHCVSARQTTRAKTGLANEQETVEKMDVKGLQTSVGAGVGGMLNITPHVGVYVEPGVSFFLEKENQPESYRTAHPVTFDLRAGLRFRFR